MIYLFFPFSLARYSILSAIRNSLSKSLASSGYEAVPIEHVILLISLTSSWYSHDILFFIVRSMLLIDSSSSKCSMTINISSPPIRPHIPLRPTASLNICATSRSTSSPNICPYVSLMVLKSSISIIAIVTLWFTLLSISFLA